MKISKKSQQKLLKKEEDFNRIERIVAGMDKPKLPDIDAEWDVLEKQIDKQFDKRVFYLSAKTRIVAASVACLIFILTGLYSYLNLKEIKYATTNLKNNIILKDGSEISMNKNSNIQYNAGYGIINRKIVLSGEAFFKVKKGKGTFIVSTLAAEIRVTGTQFNVKARKGKTEVGVSEGRVEFSSAKIHGPKVMLTKGLYSSCLENSLPEQARAIQFSEFPGWMHDRLIYHGASVKEIIADIEDQYNIDIKVSDSNILGLEVSGIITGSKPEEVLQTLCVLIGKNFRLNNNIYEVY